MPRTHKPSSWQPSNWQFDNKVLEEAKNCYPPPVMEEIIKVARLEKIESDPVKRKELEKILERNIIDLAVEMINLFNLLKRPRPAQRKAALKRIEKATHTMNEALMKLDGDSSEDLRRAMLSDSFSSWALGTTPEFDIPRPLRGYAKFNTLLDIISKLEQWAMAAQQRTVEPKDGDKRADAKHWFAKRLINIWITIGYKKPTVTWRGDLHPPKTTGIFMEFTNAAARPFNLLPMEAALRQGIKQWKIDQGKKKGSKDPA